MSIPVNNSTTVTCPVCTVDYRPGERNDTDTVVELACHHFFHKSCIESWLVHNENNQFDLTCGYCGQVSMPKREALNFSVEGLEAYFSTIDRNPYQGCKRDVIFALKQLRPRSESILNLLRNILSAGEVNEAGAREFSNWLKNNIQPEFRCTAGKIIGEFLERGGALRTLQQEIRDLSYIDSKYWSAIVPEEGIAVHDHSSDNTQFRMKISKDYFIRATKTYVHRKEHNIPDFDRIHNLGKFEESLSSIRHRYNYDPEVLGCLQDIQNLRKEIYTLILSNSDLSIEKIFSLLNNMIINSKVSDKSKEIIPLVINEILFDHGALRTLSQEVNRWKKEPIDQWPSQFKEEGIQFLDKDNLVTYCEIEYFEKLVTAVQKFDNILNIGKFEESINRIQASYLYDREVLESIQDLKNLRKDIAKFIEDNCALPTKEIFFLVKAMVIKSSISDCSKKTIPLLINEVIFERGALRTLAQEVNRWKKEPMEQWPSEIKQRGINFLDEKNTIQHCEIKVFANHVHSQLQTDKICSVAKFVFVGVTGGILVKKIFGVKLF